MQVQFTTWTGVEVILSRNSRDDAWHSNRTRFDLILATHWSESNNLESTYNFNEQDPVVRVSSFLARGASLLSELMVHVTLYQGPPIKLFLSLS